MNLILTFLRLPCCIVVDCSALSEAIDSAPLTSERRNCDFELSFSRIEKVTELQLESASDDKQRWSQLIFQTLLAAKVFSTAVCTRRCSENTTGHLQRAHFPLLFSLGDAVRTTHLDSNR